jgi:chitodextrinase
MVRVGAAGIYISMFDEFNEGNQIVKTAENASFLPTNGGLLGLDEDGTACSSDYYLRLTADGGRMLKGQLALTTTRPTQPVVSSDTTPPTVPGNLTVTGHSDTTVSLSWSASTDNVGVAGYRVYTVSGSNHTQVASTSALTVVVTGLTASTAYTLVVAAYDAAGNVSGYSNSVSVTTDATTTNLALNMATSASSNIQNYVSSNAVDGNTSTYWESANNAFPQWIGVDLATSVALSRVVLTLPASWGARTQTLVVSGSVDNSTFSTLVASAGYPFDPSTANTVTIPVSGTARYVRITGSANTGWPAVQVSELQVYGTAGPPPSNPNLAKGKATSESGHTQTYASSNAVDGDPNTYWESVDNAFPQWLQVDLGSATSISRLVLKLPPSTAWATRTQTLVVASSTDGSTFTTRVNSAGYTFNPATGNTTTITFTAVSARYVRLTFTANTGWPAGQVSELEVYAS